MLPLADLPSYIPGDPHRSSERLDPYWDGVWQHGAVAQWASREHLERMEAAGIAGRRPKRLSTSAEVARERLRAYAWKEKLDLLGVLASWRTVTAEQYAAFTGCRLGSRKAETAIGDLFALDVVDTGALWAPGGGGAAAARGQMLRPTASTAFDDVVSPRLTFAERVSVTAGEDFLTGGQYDRHNVLTAELALRAAEFLPLGTVLGERQASVPLLAYASAGLPEPPGGTQQAGDAVFVRPDGVRIVIELTASWSRFTERKAEMWARTLARRPFEESGIIVVFVVANRTDAGSRKSGRNSIGVQVRKSISRVSRVVAPGIGANRTAERMFVVDWRDWFPARHEASPEFLLLQAQRPSGANGEWEDASLLDTGDVHTPAATAELSAVSHYAAGLRLVPYQLRRQRQPPNLSTYSLSRLGFDTPPSLMLDPRTGAPRDSVNRGYGVRPAGEHIPDRLRF